jgi:flagellar export protein FliJ
MGFRFRYESLLNYRRHLKEKAEMDLARARQKLRQSMEALKTYEKGLVHSRKTLDQKLRTHLPSGEVKNYSDYFISLKEKIGFAEAEISQCEKSVRQKMQALLSVSKDFKAIEKLKEKEFTQWNHQQHLDDMKRMNEIAIVRHGKTP